MMKLRTLQREPGAMTENEHFMQTVERFIMGVTENLCRLENEHVEPGQEEPFRRSKALILTELDRLEGLLASFRAGDTQKLLDALTSVADMAVTHRLPQRPD